jgi:polyisoprenoid-binding protein YceI
MPKLSLPVVLVAPLLAAISLPANVVGPRRTDTNHSTVGFSVPIAGGLSSVTGKFSRFKLDFHYDPEEPEKTRVLAVIDVTSVDTGIDGRDEHLLSDDFFHADEFPEITFESFEVQTTDEPDHLIVIGVLTIRDESRDCELDVRILEDPSWSPQIGFHATTSFDRQDFGVRYKHRDLPDFIGDEVQVNLRILTSPRK